MHVQFAQHGRVVEIEDGSAVVIGKLRHAICVAKDTESEAYAQATRGYGVVPRSGSAEHDIACCADRHLACYFTSRKSNLTDVPPVPTRKRLDLAVLGASRQLYELGYHILWTTNTFSFDDPVSFIASLSIPQLQKLKSLHLID